MKGLLTKDLCLLLQRKRSFLIVFLCGIALSFTTDGTFFIGWLMLIGSLFTLSTIAYDEHDNSFPFLMTLPVSRRCYAIEKYVFGMICALVCWGVSILFSVISASVLGNRFVWSWLVPVLLLMPLLILDVSIPLNLRFGSEKGRIYMFVVWGILFAAGFGWISASGKEPGLSGDISMAAVIAAGVGITLAATVVSVMLSMRIMRNKEF